MVTWFTRPQMVTHQSINRAQRRATTLIETNMLPLSHATTANRSSAINTRPNREVQPDQNLSYFHWYHPIRHSRIQTSH